jgi:6-pyruvoyltetrahydropterin/6-carboxytetrahydropterin synthase
MSIVRLTKRIEFSASHRYHNPHWSESRNRAVFGSCNNIHGHGHNYLLEATVEGTVDPATGMVVNLYDLKLVIAEVIEEFDHKDLSLDTPYFEGQIPTTENLAVVLWEKIEGRLRGGRLSSLRLFEEEDLFVDYQGHRIGQVPEAYCTRRYRFAAAHRLHTPALSDEDNRKVFGKCNNPNGHGHNYTLEVTVRGAIDVETGMVTDVTRLDEVVNERVVRRFDHQHLNYDEDFGRFVTTGENLVMFIWNVLDKAIPTGALHKIGLVETRDNYFEYHGSIQEQKS